MIDTYLQLGENRKEMKKDSMVALSFHLFLATCCGEN